METDGTHSIIIVGGGIGGLSVALRLADHGHAVTVLAKNPLDQTASFYAQGGIAAVMNAEDSLSAHEADTVIAGAGLCHSDTVAKVVEQGPECIRWLQEQGVEFTRNPSDGDLHLTREGGHSRRRIVHADDATGAAVMRVLAQRAKSHPAIKLREGAYASQLVTSASFGTPGPNRCVGLRLIDTDNGRLEMLWADAVVLATGGAAGVYEHATNYATGDGIAMAWRAGCRIANLEFIQFHPTCLYSAGKVSGLITEAVRGEGGALLRPDGTPFMRGYDERGDLAPRDIVSRAIVSEMRKLEIDHVFLDISHEPAELIRERFPNVLQLCAAHGYDLTAEPIPVVPAAHYTCGGIVVDARGQTDLLQLYALGECSFTGLHGANRLASNSLLEALAFADTISRDIAQSLGVNRYDKQTLPVAGDFSVHTSATSFDQVVAWTRLLRQLMWRHVGIVRTRDGLVQASAEIKALEAELERAMGRDPHSIAALELRNMLTVAKLVTQSAEQRHESRGLHFNTDYPQPGVDSCDSSIQLGLAESA